MTPKQDPAAAPSPATAPANLVQFSVRLTPEVRDAVVSLADRRQDGRRGEAAPVTRAVLEALFEGGLIHEVRAAGPQGASLKEQVAAVVHAGVAALRAAGERSAP